MANSSFFSQSGTTAAVTNTIQTSVDAAEAAKVAAEAAQTAAETAETDSQTAQAASEAARDVNGQLFHAERFKVHTYYYGEEARSIHKYTDDGLFSVDELIDTVPGSLMQGIENGRAYSFVIEQDLGLLTAALARDGVTLSVFGACTDARLK